MVTFLFSVHNITEAKQYAGLGRAVDLPAKSFDLVHPSVVPPLIKYHGKNYVSANFIFIFFT